MLRPNAATSVLKDVARAVGAAGAGCANWRLGDWCACCVVKAVPFGVHEVLTKR